MRWWSQRGGAIHDVVRMRRPGAALSPATILLILLACPGGYDTLDAGPLFPAPMLVTGNSVSQFVVEDLNGDGRLDVAVLNTDSNDLSVFLQNSEGTFGQQVRYATGKGAGRPEQGALVSADFNGDGYLDVIAWYPTSAGLWVFLGNGDGTFAPSIQTVTLGNLRSVAVGDFNGDGKSDLAVANGDGLVYLMQGTTTGQMSPGLSLTAGQGPSGVVAADFDGDSRIDVAVLNSESQQVSLLLGNGDGTFRPQATYPVAPYSFVLAVGDFDGNGRPDLLVSMDFILTVFLNDGDGTFTPGPQQQPGSLLYASSVGDLNGDGKDDFVAVGDSSGIFISRGDGTFAEAPGPAARGEPGGFVAVADVNGDGLNDVLATYLLGVGIFRGNGDGTVASPATFTDVSFGPGLIVGDFNGDKHEDLAFGGIVVFPGVGDGSFSAPITSVAGGSSGLGSGDFNADGKPDLAWSVLPANHVEVALGRGDGTFGAAAPYEVGGGPIGQVIADFTSDGIPDVATANTYSGDVSVLPGLGDGTFGPEMRFQPSPLGCPVDQHAVVGGDFNGDGKMDLAIIGLVAADTSLRLLFGDGHGGFSLVASYALLLQAHYVNLAVADFNGDGRDDLVLSGDGGAVAMLSSPRGFSGPGTDLGVIGGLSTIVAGDFNDDGRADVVVGKPLIGGAVILGNGDGSFAAPMYFEATFGVQGFAVGDFNEDGRADLAVASSAGVGVLLNQGPFPVKNPRAVIAAPEQVECDRPAGGGVTLDGSGSVDPNSGATISSYEWFRAYGQPAQQLLGTGARLFVSLPLGTSSVTLRIMDTLGLTATSTSVITVADTTPPALRLSVTPTVLWPPDHRLVPTQVGWQVSDICDPEAEVALASATSGEPDDAPGNGDGNTTGDIQEASIGAPSTMVLLRAERSGGGPGRVYRLTYTARDASGNITSEAGLVVVPHDLASLRGPASTSARRHPGQGGRRRAMADVPRQRP